MSIFDEIRNLRKTGREPYQWYRNRIRELGAPSSSELIRDGRLSGRYHIGRLNMFLYDPKYKDKLPYYDVFPLVLPIKRYSDGFLGINFHYLPYALRARLMKRLEDDARGPQSDMRILTSYGKLQNVNIVKPTLKRYLYQFTRSRFRRIDSEDFVTALMLPVQRFRKSSTAKVWADSRKAI